DLTLDVLEGDDGLLLNYVYATDLFDQDTIARFVTYFERIVDTVLSNPDILLSDIVLLDKKEEQLLLQTFNDTKVDYPRDKTIIDLFEAQVKINPNRVAVTYAEGSITYEKLRVKSNQIAAYLQNELDVKKGDLVGLLIDREADLIPLIFGIMKSGGVYLPLSIEQPLDRIRSIVSDSGLGVLIGHEKHIDTSVLGEDITFLDIDGLDQKIANQDKEYLRDVSGSDLAYVIYTSGSTGQPKGVMIEHHSVVNQLQWAQDKYPLTIDDVLLQKTPLVFDVSIWELFRWSISGASLYLLPPEGEKDPRSIIDGIDTNGVTVIHFVPSMLSVFLSDLSTADMVRLQSLRQVFSSGEALSIDHVYSFRDTLYAANNTALINLYGPTEATVHVSYYECDFKESDIRIPIGKPIDNTSFYVIDRFGHLCPIGVIGELCIGGAGVSVGYLNNDSLTKEKFVDNPYHAGEKVYRTGDLCRWLADGSIDFLGRKDFQIKLRGYRIELGEIEYQVQRYEGVEEAVVILGGDSESDRYLASYYVSEEELLASDLRDHLVEVLPEYMIPTYYVHLESIPLTVNGKVAHKSLPVPEISAGAAYEPASNEVEEKLVEIWGDILRLDSDVISVTRSFFELGGNSFKVNDLVNRLSSVFNVKVPLIEIFKRTTIRSISEHISSLPKIQTSVKEKESIISISKSETTNNLFMIHDVSGDINGYIKLAGLLKSYNCWGIRNTSITSFSPKELTIQELATNYIKKIKQIQAKGPYTLLGWSLGGIVAYEIVRQMKHLGDTVHQLFMIDSQVPSFDDSKIFSLSIKEEKDLLTKLLKEEEIKLDKIDSIEGLWKKCIPILIKKDNKELVEALPEYFKMLIPDIDKIAIEHLITNVNTIRSLYSAFISFKMKDKLETQLIYIKASSSPTTIESFTDYFEKEISSYVVQGDHYSILKEPGVFQLPEVINNI
ncbi:amino acid adenylation domain-containing protein, partial [Aquimarina sp. AU474]|uniref:non-ribosomal peptide synthetase n=1 Tax=Aquimarina sp. AU474 TaxID=2108529 RepID=UPI0013576A05